jgi:hypothetical protein
MRSRPEAASRRIQALQPWARWLSGKQGGDVRRRPATRRYSPGHAHSFHIELSPGRRRSSWDDIVRRHATVFFRLPTRRPPPANDRVKVIVGIETAPGSQRCMAHCFVKAHCGAQGSPTTLFGPVRYQHRARDAGRLSVHTTKAPVDLSLRRGRRRGISSGSKVSRRFCLRASCNRSFLARAGR